VPLSLVLLNQRGQVLTAEEEASAAEGSEVAAGLDRLEVVAVTTAGAFVVAPLVASMRQPRRSGRCSVVCAEAELVSAHRATLHLGARPSYQQGFYSGRASRSITPSFRPTTAASRPQNRFSSSGTVAQRGLNGRTDHIAERHDANWHRDWDRRHAHFFHNRFFVFDDGFWFGLDAGFYPWDYLPYYGDDYYPYDYYADDQPYDNTEPYDSGVPVADPTVQATQTRLSQLGYYNGPVDGIFGPATRDAVANYQIANQLNVTGSLSPDTLQSLGLPQVTSS
jgi:hypothetical protein